MKKSFKILICAGFSIVVIFLLAAVTMWLWLLKPNYYLPSQAVVRQQFESHRADYIKFVTLLQKDPSAQFIGSDGMVDIDGVHRRQVPEYRDLIRQLGIKEVTVRNDGSIEFALWGDGGAIISDSYLGVRYFPKNRKPGSIAGWKPTVVASLATAKLPRENKSVATGLYVVPIEPEWFIYRLEYQE
jgi:hypothetical protein